MPSNKYKYIGAVLPFEGVNIFSQSVFESDRFPGKKFIQEVKNGIVIDFIDITEKIEFEVLKVYSTISIPIGSIPVFSYLYYDNNEQRVIHGDANSMKEQLVYILELSDLTRYAKCIVFKFNI